MHDMVLKLDELGRPAWLGLMVVSFILFWPLGLAILAFLLWSGRMGRGWGCSYGDRARWQQRFADKWERRGGGDAWRGRAGFPPSGNRAFDEYREETLKRLEDEQREFRDFLERLRLAKDRSEFDQFMAERKNRPAGPTPDDSEGDRPEGSSPPQQT
ncbi:DUF2852 domain-containing protein [Hyphomicrobium sp.]|uniref:DUF2852 domain-containing protein n=1 Tax=Hyphomicrobium sp. TaxID=82 RepID=UPI0025BA9E5D|nr:DUF2852 domain-containing protein [Hyphomicrobium sp.]MCC7252580.1 DUF2852 domain-containing protein [Hyphomicrobium sp.]